MGLNYMDPDESGQPSAPEESTIWVDNAIMPNPAVWGKWLAPYADELGRSAANLRASVPGSPASQPSVLDRKTAKRLGYRRHPDAMTEFAIADAEHRNLVKRVIAAMRLTAQNSR